MPGAQLAQSPEKGEVCITEALITQRNLTFPEDEALSERMFHTIAELQTVRLDREGITTIKNLEGLQNLHSLYLQGNKIQRIENLACVPSLRFLSLAGNRIRQVENLRDLPYLQFLDLSENLIATLQPDEFPQSLLILNLIGNSCTSQDGYRKRVTGALPLLMDLDRQPVSERWNSDEEDKASDEEFPELSGPFRAERGDPASRGPQPPQSSALPRGLWGSSPKPSSASGPEDSTARARCQPGHPGFLEELEQDMSRHKAHRQQAARTEHLLRLETQPVLTELPQLPGRSMAEDPSAAAPQQGKEPPPEAASSATKKPGPLASRGPQNTVQARKGVRTAAAPKASLAGAPSTTKTVTRRVKK